MKKTFDEMLLEFKQANKDYLLIDACRSALFELRINGGYLEEKENDRLIEQAFQNIDKVWNTVLKDAQMKGEKVIRMQKEKRQKSKSNGTDKEVF